MHNKNIFQKDAKKFLEQFCKMVNLQNNSRQNQMGEFSA